MRLAKIQVDYIRHCGDDLAVANAARVSFHKESELEYPIVEGYADYEGGGHLSNKDAKLIGYLAKHKHFSPFNHSFITLRIKAPIFVARQLVKHKFMPWNEVSRRYVDEEPEFFLPEYWRQRGENIKQGSSEEAVSPNTTSGWLIEQYNSDCLFQYRMLLKDGCSPEQARMVLPQNVMTEWIWSGTLGAWCDMMRLRLDPHTQYESRIVAQKAKEIIEPLFPVSVSALLEV